MRTKHVIAHFSQEPMGQGALIVVAISLCVNFIVLDPQNGVKKMNKRALRIAAAAVPAILPKSGAIVIPHSLRQSSICHIFASR
jgi:hypothetical protein